MGVRQEEWYWWQHLLLSSAVDQASDSSSDCLQIPDQICFTTLVGTRQAWVCVMALESVAGGQPTGFCGVEERLGCWPDGVTWLKSGQSQQSFWDRQCSHTYERLGGCELCIMEEGAMITAVYWYMHVVNKGKTDQHAFLACLLHLLWNEQLKCSGACILFCSSQLAPSCDV